MKISVILYKDEQQLLAQRYGSIEQGLEKAITLFTLFAFYEWKGTPIFWKGENSAESVGHRLERADDCEYDLFSFNVVGNAEKEFRRALWSQRKNPDDIDDQCEAVDRGVDIIIDASRRPAHYKLCYLRPTIQFLWWKWRYEEVEVTTEALEPVRSS